MSRIAREASPRTASKWAARIRDSVAMLEQFPEIGGPLVEPEFEGLRERVVGPFRIIYRYDGSDCLILTFARAEQDLRQVLDPDNLP